MQKALNFSAEEILQIDINSPEKLFSRDAFDVEFKRLRKKWHTDYNSNPKAKDVFIHLMALAETAQGRIATNTWNGQASLKYTVTSGKTFRFSYRKFRTFELGRMYIGQKYVIYVIDGENKDLYDNGIKAIKGIKYPNDKFKTEFKKLLPDVVQSEETDIGYVLVIKKPKDAVLLQDLLDFLPDNILPSKHTAWVVSSMYNIAMFFNHIGITHNSILASTIFVNPKEHTCYLLGGWWYSVKENTKLKAMPSELTKILPAELFADKTSNTSYDRQSIKALAVRCLGDSTLMGSKLLFNKEIPKAMVTWIRTPSKTSAFEEYSGWIKSLENSYGKRKFTEFKYDISQLY